MSAQEFSQPSLGLDPMPDTFVDELDGRFYLVAVPHSETQTVAGAFEKNSLAKLLGEHGEFKTLSFEQSVDGPEVRLHLLSGLLCVEAASMFWH